MIKEIYYVQILDPPEPWQTIITDDKFYTFEEAYAYIKEAQEEFDYSFRVIREISTIESAEVYRTNG